MLTTIPRLAFVSVLVLAGGILTGSPTVLLSQPASDGDTPFALTDDEGQSWPGARSALLARRTFDIRRKADERLRRFPDSPNTVGWLWQAHRYDDALDVLARVVERQPMQLPAALSGAAVLVTTFQPDQARRYRPRLQSVAAAARAALSSLDREQAAKVAAALIPIELVVAEPPVGDDVLVDRVIAEYPGTEAARLLEVDRIARGGVTQAQLDALDAFAAKQPGTVVAAKARYLKGFHLAHNRTSMVLGGASPDPTESFLELLDIVADLESGRYPPSTWVSRAAQLVTGYSMFRPVLAPENARRMIAGIMRFAREHQALIAEPKAGDSMRFLLTNTMARVAAFLPDGPAVMERQWASLAQAWPDPAPAKLVRAACLRPGQAALSVLRRWHRRRRRGRPRSAHCSPKPPAPRTPKWRQSHSPRLRNASSAIRHLDCRPWRTTGITSGAFRPRTTRGSRPCAPDKSSTLSAGTTMPLPPSCGRPTPTPPSR